MNNSQKPVFHVLTFDSTSFAIQSEKKIKEDFKIAVMPTPRELTASCGLAIKFLENGFDEIIGYVKELDVPCKLYAMTEEKMDGKRGVQLLFSND
ncbi:MAG: DUF3343 domain-containing protein [Anaerovorax sp.]